MSILAEEEHGNMTSVEDCTDVMLQYDGRDGSSPNILLGHNEDNSKDTVETSYFVFASVVGPEPLSDHN